MTGSGSRDLDVPGQRHREMIERLDRIVLGLEALHQHGDRQSRLLAEISAKVESSLRYFIKTWQLVRGSERR